MSDSTPVLRDTSDDPQALSRAVLAHGLTVPDAQIVQLAQYCRLLWDWNSRLNLTRHTDWELFVTRDLLDTLMLSEHVPEGVRILDVGSGGGVPGIVLAILRPDLKVALCDSVGKKVVALKNIIQTLGLPVEVYADRAENLLKRQRFQVVTMRAVGSISKVLGWLRHVWGATGQLLLIKGPRWVEEQAEAQLDGSLKQRKVEHLSSWSTAGRDGQSVLLRITKPGRVS